MRRIFRTLLIACLGAALLPAAWGQAGWPNRAIRIITPGPAGSAPDIFARMYADQLSKALGQGVVVENRPGASGNLGTDAVAKAPADGYTILYGYNQLFTMNPHLFSKMPFDALKDLIPVTQTLKTAYVVLANNGFAPRNMAELIELAKKEPGNINYASYGPGTASHLIFELVEDLAKIRMQQVPYKQSPVPDVMAGQVTMVIEPFGSGIPQVKAGKVRALAVTSARRVAALPDVPAISETLPGFDVPGWNGIWVPAGTPREIVARLNSEFARITRTPELLKRIADTSSEPTGTSVEDTATLLRNEYEQWGKIIRAKNIRLD